MSLTETLKDIAIIQRGGLKQSQVISIDLSTMHVEDAEVCGDSLAILPIFTRDRSTSNLLTSSSDQMVLVQINRQGVFLPFSLIPFNQTDLTGFGYVRSFSGPITHLKFWVPAAVPGGWMHFIVGLGIGLTGNMLQLSSGSSTSTDPRLIGVYTGGQDPGGGGGA